MTGVIPTWVQEGGHDAWIKRMKDPSVRPRLLQDIRDELSEQPPEGILMVGFKTPDMSKKYLAKTVAEAAQMRGQSPEEAIVDMVIEDDNRIQCIYFSMSEENIRKKYNFLGYLFVLMLEFTVIYLKVLELIQEHLEVLRGS